MAKDAGFTRIFVGSSTLVRSSFAAAPFAFCCPKAVRLAIDSVTESLRLRRPPFDIVPSMTTAFARLMTCVGLVIASLTAAGLHAQNGRLQRTVADPGVVTTRQAITPAGVQTVFDGKVYGVTFGATADELWVLVATRSGPAIYQLDWRENRTAARWPLQGTAALQGLAFDPERQSPLVGIARPAPREGVGGVVQLLRRDGDGFAPLADDLGRYLAASPAIASSRSADRAILPLVFDNALAVVNRATGAVISRIKTGGVAPFGSVISRDGATAWVSNWGGRWPKDGDPTL